MYKQNNLRNNEYEQVYHVNSVYAEGDPVYNLLCVKTVIVDSSPTLSRHSLKALFITILGNSVDGTLQKVHEPIVDTFTLIVQITRLSLLNEAGKFCDSRVFSLFLQLPKKELAW